MYPFGFNYKVVFGKNGYDYNDYGIKGNALANALQNFSAAAIEELDKLKYFSPEPSGEPEIHIITEIFDRALVQGPDSSRRT
jgi:hypothetical protein